MEPNESGLPSYFHQHQQQPISTLSPTLTPPSAAAAATPTTPSPITNGGLADGATANAAGLYPQSVAGKAPVVEPQRRKRGRPRKYGTPEAAAAAKRAALPVKRKEQPFLTGGSSSHSSSPKNSNLLSVGGLGFTPHVINVAAGEDVGQKIMLLMQQTGRELCILSASGSVSHASLCQPATSGGSIAYELIVATFLIDPKKDASTGLKGEASATKMTSPVSASNAVYRPVVESSGGFTVTGGDNHQNMDGNSFMMQPQWRGGIDYDLAGNTGNDTHDSPENGDYD